LRSLFRLDPHARIMVLIHGAYNGSSLLAGTFLSIYLWRASHDLTPIAIYSALSALMIPLAFLATACSFAGWGPAPRPGSAWAATAWSTCWS
jgi:hypothetical protein